MARGHRAAKPTYWAESSRKYPGFAWTTPSEHSKRIRAEFHSLEILGTRTLSDLGILYIHSEISWEEDLSLSTEFPYVLYRSMWRELILCNNFSAFSFDYTLSSDQMWDLLLVLSCWCSKSILASRIFESAMLS